MNIVAIIAAFNEGDVIYHVIGDLIKNGLKVYFIDNCSTDNTVSEAGKWLGKGLIKIERFPDDSGYSEINKSKYVWKEILKRKEEIAQELNADWYIHTDADEFRESPFPGTTLSEGIKIIDAIGFNAINFQVLNFRPIDNSFFSGKDVRDYLRGFEEGEWFDEHQVKAWKNTGVRVNLSESGGHKCDFPNRKVCPLNFILRHYPIRSQIQGEIKLYTERFPRFTKEERNNG